MTDGMTVLSLSTRLRHKTSVATNRLCQVVFNQKLLHKFKKWCKF